MQISSSIIGKIFLAIVSIVIYLITCNEYNIYTLLMSFFMIIPVILSIFLDKSEDNCLSICITCFNLMAVLINTFLINNFNIVENVKVVHLASFLGLLFYVFVPQLIYLMYRIVLQIKYINTIKN